MFRFFARRSYLGFSLVEMLVVIAIVAILAVLTIPALSSMTRSYRLNAASDLMIGQLNLARQTALSQSHLVQVRFYSLPDYGQPPTGTSNTYRAMQSFVEGDPDATGTPALTAVTSPIFFPLPVVLSTVTAPDVSPLLTFPPSNSTMKNPNTPGSSDPTLPTYGKNYAYLWFHFKPDGSTDLTAGKNSVTLVLENDKSASSGLPANYWTIEIDPAIGTARRFGP